MTGLEVDDRVLCNDFLIFVNIFDVCCGFVLLGQVSNPGLSDMRFRVRIDCKCASNYVGLTSPLVHAIFRKKAKT